MKYLILLMLLALGCVDAEGCDPVTPPSLQAAIASEIAEAVNPVVTNDTKLEPVAEVPKVEQVKPAKVTPRLIVFTAIEWCMPCKVYGKQIAKLEAMEYLDSKGVQHTWAENIGEESGDTIQVIDCSNPDSLCSKQMAFHEIKFMPTTIRLDENGHEESRVIGILTAERLCLYAAGKWSPPHERK